MIDTSTSVATAVRARQAVEDINDMRTQITCKNGELLVQRTQDTTGYLERNKRKLNEAPSWRPYSGRTRLREVADVPNIVVEQWLKEGVNIFDPDPAMQRRVRWKLDSNEYKYLRTHPGKMGQRRQWV